MKAITLFEQRFGREPTLLTRAPGRANLLGEHVDYNGGPVLPVAIDRTVQLAAAFSSRDEVTLYAPDLHAEVSFNLKDLEHKLDARGKALPGWALYPAGVAWSLKKAGLEVPALQAVYSSDLPIGAGLSSSAAVEVAFAVTWQVLVGWEVERMTLARLCQQAENEYVGVASGLMDQFASLHGMEDHALFFDTRSLKWQALPLPPDAALVIADSGVRHSLAGSEYNQRRADCDQAVRILRESLPEMRALRDISPVKFAVYRDSLPPVVRQRAEHVVKEIARVESAVTALKRGETSAFGALMFAGHASLRDLYEVSSPELDALVEIARQLPGCHGARLTGAGFGGCTINLVESLQAAQFIEDLQIGYQSQTGRTAMVYLCHASSGAKVDRLN